MAAEVRGLSDINAGYILVSLGTFLLQALADQS
jgi:hypothetical protein